MHKILTWLGTGTMALTIWACGGKVVVDAGGNSSSNGGAGGTGNSGGTASGSPLTCGDAPIPQGLTICMSSSVGGSGGTTTCETDFCASNGDVFAAVCTGAVCACNVNGVTKCTCSTDGVSDFCSTATTPCCPWDVTGI